MNKRIVSLSILTILGIVLCSFASAETNSSYIDSKIQNNISVGLYLLNLGKYDISSGSFTVDFYLSLKCNPSCGNQEFEFMNGRASSFEKMIDLPNEKFYRIQANLNSPVDLRKFPFDNQKMQIIFEDKRNTIDKQIYSADINESGLESSISFSGWKIDGWDVEIKEHDYPIYGETYSQYIFTLNISRIILNSIIKTFLPVIFIILVMMSSFVLDPDKIGTRLGMVGSALVASVMFHVSLTNQIPPVGYLNFADKFMILTYFVLLLSFVLNVYLVELTERKQLEKVERIHRATEFTMILVILLLYALLFMFFI